MPRCSSSGNDKSLHRHHHPPAPHDALSLDAQLQIEYSLTARGIGMTADGVLSRGLIIGDWEKQKLAAKGITVAQAALA